MNLTPGTSHLTLPACLLMLAVGAVRISGAEEEFSRALFPWRDLPTLNRSLAGAFIGAHEDVIIVAGGVERGGTSNEWRYLNTVSVLEPNRSAWRNEFHLEHPLAFGATVNTPRGMILIGGTDGRQVFSEVVELRWNRATGMVESRRLADLPSPRMNGSAAVLENRLYVAGGRASLAGEPLDSFLCLDLARSQSWEQLPPCPVGGGIAPLVAVQNSGEKDSVFVFTREHSGTGDDGNATELRAAFRYDVFEKNRSRRWKQLGSVSQPFSTSAVLPLGQAHLIFFPSDLTSSTSAQVLAYHTLTDTWAYLGHLPEGLVVKTAILCAGQAVVFGKSDPAQTGFDVRQARPSYKTKGFGALNYAALGGYFLVLVWVGIHFSKKGKSANEFFLGGRRIPWWAAGLSIYGAGFSAISFMGLSAKAYATDWVYLMASAALIPVMLFTLYLFVPFVHKLEVTTAYEYLEKRFNLPVRLFGASVFILYQFGRMAIMLLFPAIALSTVTGLSVSFCVLSMGVFCILYTALGGIQAVIWNDCLQVAVLLAGAIAVLVIAFGRTPAGLGSDIATALADGKFRTAILSWDYTTACLWVVLVGNVLSNMPMYITDQAVVQKYLTTPDLRQARQSLWLNIWMCMPCAMMFFLLGTGLYVFYRSNPQLLNPLVPTDGILPWFIMQNIPAGLGGFVIAGIFAASMSSLDSSIHAVTTTVITDFYRRLKPDAPEEKYMKLARWLVAVVGAIAITTAMVISLLDIPSLLDLFLTFLGLISGGGAGIFLLGILTTRTHGTAAFIGAVASALIVFAAQNYTPMHFFLYGAVGLVSAMVLGYLLSFVLPSKPRDLSGLTLYTVKSGMPAGNQRTSIV